MKSTVEQSGTRFASAIRRNLPWMRAEARRLQPGTPSQAEDIVQSCLVGFWQKRAQFVLRSNEEFRSLLRTFLARAASRLRRTARRRHRPNPPGSPGENLTPSRLEDDGTSLSEILSRREDAAILHSALSELDASQREIIERHSLHGETFQEIGAQMSISPEAARKRHARALCRLATLALANRTRRS